MINQPNLRISPGKLTMTKHHQYYSYLMRIWQSENHVENEWFASLEDPKSREVIYFKNLDQMFAFIREIKTSEDQPSNFLTERKNMNGDGEII